MFSLAYVLLPFSEMPPAEEIRASLARFERGLRGEVADDWLRFDDETAELRAMHEERLSLSLSPNLTLHNSKHSWHLDFKAMQTLMEQRGRTEWEVRLRDVEPDFDTFVNVSRVATSSATRSPGAMVSGVTASANGNSAGGSTGGSPAVAGSADARRVRYRRGHPPSVI